MSEPKVGDVHVRKTDGMGFHVRSVTGPDKQYVTLKPEIGNDAVTVTADELDRDYERQESVQEAAERGFKPLLEGGR